MATTLRAVCLISGGPDSVAAALLSRRDGYLLHFLTILYGQKTEAKEAACAEELRNVLSPEGSIVTRLPLFTTIGGSGLLDTSVFLDRTNAKLEYVPFRNTLFLALGVAWAEVLKADRVVIGSTGPPWNTPDNKPEFFAVFQELINVGSATGSSIRVVAPFATKSKADVIRAGIELGVPFQLTWSCHNRTDVACGECSNCRDRHAAFDKIGATDPIPYV